MWGVDVNERALDLLGRNAERAGRRQRAPEPAGRRPGRPPVRRIGATHRSASARPCCTTSCSAGCPDWTSGASAYLVVQRNLGSDSLHRWLADQLGPSGYSGEPRGNGARLPRPGGHRPDRLRRSSTARPPSAFSRPGSRPARTHRRAEPAPPPPGTCHPRAPRCRWPRPAQECWTARAPWPAGPRRRPVVDGRLGLFRAVARGEPRRRDRVSSDRPRSRYSVSTWVTVVMIVAPPGDPRASTGRPSGHDRRAHRRARSLAGAGQVRVRHARRSAARS